MNSLQEERRRPGGTTHQAKHQANHTHEGPKDHNPSSQPTCRLCGLAPRHSGPERSRAMRHNEGSCYEATHDTGNGVWRFLIHHARPALYWTKHLVARESGPSVPLHIAELQLRTIICGSAEPYISVYSLSSWPLPSQFPNPVSPCLDTKDIPDR